MPWAMQADLLSMTYRSNLMSNYDLWNQDNNQIFGHYVYALNLKLIEPFFGNLQHFFSASHGMSPSSTTSSVGDWLNFVSNPQINAFIFALKIPHLLADIAIFLILAKFLSKNKKRNLILSLWWFNPVNIYAFYVFARHDSLTLLALLLATLFLAKEKIFPALLAFFAAVQIRFQPILYLPLFLIHLWRNFPIKKLIANLLLTSLAILAIILIEKNLPFDQALFDQIKGIDHQIETVQTPPETNLISQIISKPFELATSVGGRSSMNKLLIFSGVYAFLNLLYLFLKKAKNPQEAFLQLNLILYISMSVYFFINDFSPHYFVWLSLFASVSALFSKQFVCAYLLSILGWGVMGLVDPGNFAINQNLFLPVSPVIFNTPQLAYLVPHQALIFNLGRLVFSGGLLWSSYLALKYLVKDMNFKQTWKNSLKIGLFLLAFLPLVFAKPVQAAKVPVLEQDGQEKILLEPGAAYQNSFVSNSDHFGALDLKFDTSRSTEQKYLIFRLKEEGEDDWYYQNRYNIADFYNNAFYPFGFPSISDALGKKYVYEVELVTAGNYPLYIYDHSYIVSKEGSMREILQIIKSDLLTKWQNQKKFWIFWLSLLGINLLALIVVIAIPPRNKKATF
ncbi:MAG: hypothetical protein UT13_C0001G0505 [Candidatus Pacebacteria bacterium GW2011_GWF2_38_9]|nr:MAG: hypothetical protein US01_C0001G0518 [candidate division TM6 bacterium GW2011_GWF2_28_16]KKQ09318.1 MAG: hypothetical protein US20_C0008G0016 [Candidatus Pacebacteria bacterium GW2011_GWF1_36_5]KKQ88858.1 MAG: hypothetical protein UT13_C0001G0505 [Candidatus Pacebacteria bacterium GW2011_GWF2_38_9]